MSKYLYRFLIVVTIIFLVVYFAHYLSLQSLGITLSFSLLAIYIYHFIASILVFSVTYFVFKKLPNQAGYAYLVTIFLKLGFFVLIFRSSVFLEIDLTKAEKVSLIIPLFIFLIYEALEISKLLNGSNFK